MIGYFVIFFFYMLGGMDGPTCGFLLCLRFMERLFRP